MVSANTLLCNVHKYEKVAIGARTAVARLIGPIVDLAQKRLAKSAFILCNFFSQNTLTNACAHGIL